MTNIWILNPDYRFKQDLDRICMYSVHQLEHNSSEKWISYIHPFQAVILSAFDGKNTLYDVLSEISSHFNISFEESKNLILPFLENKEPIYSEIGIGKALFPKNVIIRKDNNIHKIPLRNPENLVIYTQDISLSSDRIHRAPHTMLWMLTSSCITNCAYCYADRKTPYRPLATDKCLSIIHEAHNLGINYIDIIGGEIFLRKDWEILVKEMTQLSMSPTYISTKMPVTQSILDKLIETGYNDVIQISLDSLDEQILKETIKIKDGYVKKLIDGIRMLDRHGFKIQIDTILTKKTASEQNLIELSKFLSTLENFVYWELRVPDYTIYSPKRFNEEKCDKLQISKLHDFIIQKLKVEFSGKIIYSDNVIHEKFLCSGPEEHCFSGGNCGILQDKMFILPDGKVSVCEQLYWHPEFIIGDLTKQSIEQVWQSDKAKSIFTMARTLFRETSLCSKCTHFDICNANKRRCPVKVIKAYGADNWDYPDPHCKFAPKLKNQIEYI